MKPAFMVCILRLRTHWPSRTRPLHPASQNQQLRGLRPAWAIPRPPTQGVSPCPSTSNTPSANRKPPTAPRTTVRKHSSGSTSVASVTVKTTGEEQRFVSLPTGIPLDTQEPLTPTRATPSSLHSSSTQQPARRSWRLAAKLQPGGNKNHRLGDSDFSPCKSAVSTRNPLRYPPGLNPFVAALSAG